MKAKISTVVSKETSSKSVLKYSNPEKEIKYFGYDLRPSCVNITTQYTSRVISHDPFIQRTRSGPMLIQRCKLDVKAS